MANNIDVLNLGKAPRSIIQSSDKASFDQMDHMMMREVSANPKGGSVTFKSDNVDPPPEEPGNPGVFPDEEIQRRWGLVTEKLLDGTPRNYQEVISMLREMGTENGGQAYFGTYNELVFALQQAYIEISKQSGPEIDAIKKALSDASGGLFNLRQQLMQDFERRINPTIENGGKSVFGNSEGVEWDRPF